MELVPPKPWAPGLPIEGTSSVRDICKAFGFGAGDEAYEKIGEKLASRNFLTVDDLIDECTSVEFCAIAKTCDIKKSSRSYQAALESIVKRRLVADSSVKVEGEVVKKRCGGPAICAAAPRRSSARRASR